MQTIITTDDTSAINTRDRGLNYGDGFFTTAKVIAGQVEHWQYHKARLVECAERLAFPAINFTELEQHIAKAITGCQLNVLKIVITRGEGGRGYGLPQHTHLTILITVLGFPQSYPALAKTGVSLALSPIKLAAQPLLAGLKTLNRLEQVLIKNAMAKQQCDDVLVLDHQNNVIEASAANIFAIRDNKVYTPSLEQCGIKGVYLQSLCDKLAVEFKQVSLNELTQASAVFICNSLMGAVPVSRIEQHTFNVEQSMCLLNELLAKEAKC
jgi:4-amino-4-deoxychorismate lyase